MPCKKRHKLYKQNPLCHWCGKHTELSSQDSPDKATTDHLYSRFDIERYNGTEQRFILACHGCNSARQKQDSTLYNQYCISIGRGVVYDKNGAAKVINPPSLNHTIVLDFTAFKEIKELRAGI